jgi:hypothetical protein
MDAPVCAHARMRGAAIRDAMALERTAAPRSPAAGGADAASRISLGTTVFGGMILSTALNLIFIPVLYVVIEGWRERRRGPSLLRAAKLGPEV